MRPQSTWGALARKMPLAGASNAANSRCASIGARCAPRMANVGGRPIVTTAHAPRAPANAKRTAIAPGLRSVSAGGAGKPANAATTRTARLKGVATMGAACLACATAPAMGIARMRSAASSTAAPRAHASASVTQVAEPTGAAYAASASRASAIVLTHCHATIAGIAALDIAIRRATLLGFA